MASYDKSKNADYTLAVQSALKTLGADLGAGGIDGKWGAYTEAAYQQNKAAVDALVGSMSGGMPQLQVVQVDVPDQKSFDEWLSLGDALFAAQAEAQKRSAQRQLEYGQQQLEKNRAQSAATLENAANARGFGRSSYATDMLLKNEANAQESGMQLLGSFNDALLEIEANRAANAAEYAGNMWQHQQDAVLQAQKFNAQMQQEANLRQWEEEMKRQQEMMQAYSSASLKKSGKKSSGSKKKEEGKAQTVGMTGTPGAVTVARGLSALAGSIGLKKK